MRSMKKLLNWWTSLSEVEKASTETISHLIHSGEAIISDERVAWMSTATANRAQAHADGADGAQSTGGAGKGAAGDTLSA